MAMETYLRFVIFFSLITFWSLPSVASSLPAADRPNSRINFGSAPGFGVDYALDQRSSLGVNVAAPFYFSPDFGTSRYSLHTVYQVLNENGVYMGIVAGIYGDVYFPDLKRHSPLAIQGGAAFSYDLNQKLRLRLNIVPGISLQLPPEGWVFFPPAGGFELAWQITPHIEGSLGFNGNGDILSFSWIL